MRCAIATWSLYSFSCLLYNQLQNARYPARIASAAATTPAAMAPILGPDFVGTAVSLVDCGAVDETVDVEWAVWMIVEPDCVIVNVGGRPVAIGPAVAEPTAGVLAVAPPSAEPPMIDCTAPGT